MHKICSSCKEEKPVDKFHANASRADGLAYYCKPCKRLKNNAYNKKPTARAKANARSKAYAKRNRSKRNAHGMVYWATERGHIPKAAELNCEKCDEKATDYHHDDYERPMDVRPLCARCHALLHVEQNVSLRGQQYLGKHDG